MPGTFKWAQYLKMGRSELWLGLAPPHRQKWKRKMITRMKVVTEAAVCLATALCLAAFSAAKDAPDQKAHEIKRATAAPEYDGDGKLKLPTDFKTWVFVGSSIGLDYRADVAANTTREQKPYKNERVGDFHNVYINPEAYQHYLATGKFPDKTVLVMDVYKAEDKEPRNIVQGGHFSGSNRAVEVAVKNSNRPDGSKTDWAYYAFLNPKGKAPAKAFKDASCFDCHKKHASDDNVWVQFYPVLRDLQKAK